MKLEPSVLSGDGYIPIAIQGAKQTSKKRVRKALKK
jgi:hypothetical protein